MNFAEFLVKAKQNTYAGGMKSTQLPDGAQELTFEQGSYRYRDRYYGMDYFVGEEIVLDGGKPFWCMNYAGAPTNEKCDEKVLWEFLKKSLSKITVEYPYRGPLHFQEGDWEYHNEISGKVAWFKGRETITFQGKKMYELEYHGGKVKE